MTAAKAQSDTLSYNCILQLSPQNDPIDGGRHLIFPYLLGMSRWLWLDCGDKSKFKVKKFQVGRWDTLRAKIVLTPRHCVEDEDNVYGERALALSLTSENLTPNSK